MRFKVDISAIIGLMMMNAATLINANPSHHFLMRAESDSEISTELLGDLKTLPDSELTYTGRYIKSMLQNTRAPDKDNSSTPLPTPLPAKGSDACREHTCCIWRYINLDMRKAFSDGNHGCNDLGRAAVRLGFHDAGTWSKSTGPYGGADGSIILAGECEARDDNKGLGKICAQTWKWFLEYKRYGVRMADLIQTGHNVATNVCDNGPLVPTFVGRKDRCHPSPKGTLPTEEQSGDELIELFADKTISPRGLVALVGAHTSARQSFVDPSRAGEAFDRTPANWGTDFYDEVLAEHPSEGVFRLPSDEKLSRHPVTQPAWKSYTGFAGLFPWLTVS